jgi:hypothetical protein
LPKRQAHIFNRVMIVNFDITPGLKNEVEETVPGEEFQHVIQERHASRDLILPLAIQVEMQMNIRFSGFAMYVGFPHACLRSHEVPVRGVANTARLLRNPPQS